MNIVLVLLSKGMFSDILEGMTSKIFRSRLESLPSFSSILHLTFSLCKLQFLQKF